MNRMLLAVLQRVEIYDDLRRLARYSGMDDSAQGKPFSSKNLKVFHLSRATSMTLRGFTNTFAEVSSSMNFLFLLIMASSGSVPT